MGRNKSEVVECFDSDILSILRCVSSLDELVNDVLSCMCCKPSDRRIQQILTCVVLNEVGLLSNTAFGLNEIKNEVQFIENQVQFIENEVILVNNSINNQVFGLNAINSRVNFIENEVNLINNTVNDPVVGLSAIKNDIRVIENEVILINNSVNNQTFGLSEINSRVNFIEDEVNLINNSINSQVFGLSDIDSRVRVIEEISLHEFPELTSGPVFVRENAHCLTIKIFNSTATEHTVRVRVLDLDRSPATEIFDKSLKIKEFSTNQFNRIELSEQDFCCSCCNKNECDFNNYDDFAEKTRTLEIVLTDMVPGLYPAAVQTQKDRLIIDSTFIKSADFIPKAHILEPQ